MDSEVGGRRRVVRSPDLPGLLPALLADPDAEAGHATRTTRDWIVDTVCFLLTIGVGAMLYGILDHQDRLVPMPLLAADVGIAALSSVALWWRRRFPVILGVAFGLLGAVFALAAGAAMIALFTVAVHRRFSVVAPVALLHIVTLVPYYLLFPDPTTPFWGAVGYAVLFIAATTAWGMTVRVRRQLVLSLKDRAHRAEEEQQLRAEQARRADRARIAREMHDVLAHRISLLSTYAGALEFRRDASPEEVARAAGVMRGSAHQALQDLREVIGVLREDADTGEPGDADGPERPQPTLADLRALVEESREAGMRLTWTGEVQPADRMPDSVGRGAYRIVQESLTNVRKHAPGTAVTLMVDGAPRTGLTVEVRNRMPVGRDAEAMPEGGSGLLGLAERVNLAGGHVEHGPTADGDFRLRAWLPWPE